MKTLDRYVVGLVTRRSLVLAGAIFAVLVGGQAAVFLGRGAPPEALLDLLVPLMVFAAPIVLPLSLSAGVMVAIGSLHRDGQFQALAAAGVSPRRVVWALWPAVAVVVVVSAVLAHVLMPEALRGIRAGRDRFAAAMIEQVIANREPIPTALGSIWASDAERGRLRDVVVSLRDDDGRTVIMAPSGRWQRWSGQQAGSGSLTLHDAEVVRITAPIVTITRMHTPRLTLSPPQSSEPSEVDDNPDIWSTARLIPALWSGEPPLPPNGSGSDAWHEFNSARLALSTRIFLPIAVIILSIFAAGFALTTGRSEALLAMGMMAILTLGSVYPAISYIKGSTNQPKIHPAWIMGVPAAAMLLSGLWMLRRAGSPGTLLPRRGA